MNHPASSKISLDTEISVVLKPNAVPVYREPSLDSPVKFSLKKQDTFSVTGKEGNWYRVRLKDGRSGWSQKKFFSSLLNLNFMDADIRDALSALAIEQEVNIATAKGVSGKVSIHLFQVTLKDALDAITMAGGFNYQKLGDVYYVYQPKEEKDPETESLQMRIFELKYAEMDQVQDILGAIPGIRLIKIHESTRSIIVEDTPQNIKKVETIIEHWDTKPRQVVIEAKILEVNLTDDMSLGVDWDKIFDELRITTDGFSTAVLPDGEAVSPVPSAGGTGLFANIITGAGTSHQFAAALDAIESKTTVNTLSTPKVLAIHGKPAKVQVGGQQGYRVTTTNLGVATETIEFIDTGIVLEITPYIDDESNVLLNVQPSITSATLEEGIPVTQTALVTTWLLARNGDTVLIGGLIQDRKLKSKNQIPCLGNIPGLGVLFGSRSKDIGKTELIVLITPRVLDPERESVEQREAVEKTKKMEESFAKEPLPTHEKFLEFLFLWDEPAKKEQPAEEEKAEEEQKDEESTISEPASSP